MRLSRTCALTVASLALVACDSGGSASPATLATTSSAAPITSAPSSSVSTTAASTTTSTGVTTTVGSSVPATTAPGAIGLSAGGPWTLVDSAPGITTPGLVYELMPKLWVYLPVTEDLSQGITWTFNEDDRPIIEAYLQARLVYFKAITSNPIDLSSPDWAKWYADGGGVLIDQLAGRRADGQVADLDIGVVLRPQVTGDERSDTSGIVFDCVLDGGFFKNLDGSLAPGSTRGVVEDGIGMRLALGLNGWQVTQVGQQPDACL